MMIVQAVPRSMTPTGPPGADAAETPSGGAQFRRMFDPASDGPPAWDAVPGMVSGEFGDTSAPVEATCDPQMHGRIDQETDLILDQTWPAALPVMLPTEALLRAGAAAAGAGAPVPVEMRQRGAATASTLEPDAFSVVQGPDSALSQSVGALETVLSDGQNRPSRTETLPSAALPAGAAIGQAMQVGEGIGVATADGTAVLAKPLTALMSTTPSAGLGAVSALTPGPAANVAATKVPDAWQLNGAGAIVPEKPDLRVSEPTGSRDVGAMPAVGTTASASADPGNPDWRWFGLLAVTDRGDGGASGVAQGAIAQDGAPGPVVTTDGIRSGPLLDDAQALATSSDRVVEAAGTTPDRSGSAALSPLVADAAESHADPLQSASRADADRLRSGQTQVAPGGPAGHGFDQAEGHALTIAGSIAPHPSSGLDPDLIHSLRTSDGIYATIDLASVPSNQIDVRQAGAPAPVPLPDLAERILRGASDLQRAGMDLVLAPEELGRLQISFSTDGDRLHVALLADRPETLDLLRRNAGQLAEEFREAGFAGATFSFDRSDQGTPSSAPRPQGGQTDAPTGTPDAAPDNHPQPPQVWPALPGQAGLDLRL